MIEKYKNYIVYTQKSSTTRVNYNWSRPISNQKYLYINQGSPTFLLFIFKCI